jgi:hypothetical protein
MNYLDKVLYLFPDLQNVVYWHDICEEAPSEDAYERLIWNNNDIPKPSKDDLDALDENAITTELNARNEEARKIARNAKYSKDLAVLAGYDAWKMYNSDKNINDYLDHLETLIDL